MHAEEEDKEEAEPEDDCDIGDIADEAELEVEEDAEERIFIDINKARKGLILCSVIILRGEGIITGPQIQGGYVAGFCWGGYG